MEAVGRYRVLRRLGAGAFATVWLAHDDDLDVPVAVKVLAENWTSNDDIRRRFVEEARVLRRISEPRVVGVHDIGTSADGRSYFVMDYADAGTVADLVGHRLDPPAALATAVEVARAVQVLHDHGVLHRDVKPSNLLLRHRPDGSRQLMIADLGTAKALAEASGLTLSAGTPAYMAPEQAHGQQGLDERADVYGVAAVTYALLAGSPPFAGSGGVSEVALRDPALRPAPLELPGAAGAELDRVLSEALSFDPGRRPRTVAVLAQQLEQLRESLDAHPGSRAGAVPVEAPRGPAAGGSISVRRLAGLAVLVFVLVAGLTWLVLGVGG